MPCNMPAKGKTITFKPVSEGETLEELLTSLLEGKKGFLKVDAVFDTELDSCRMLLDLEDGKIIGACLECSKGTLSGENAVKELASKWRDQLIRGYIEFVEMSGEAIGIDRDSMPMAFLEEPIEINDIKSLINKAHAETSDKPDRKPQENTHTTTTANTVTDEPILLTEPSLDIHYMLADAIVYSETVAVTRNFEEAVKRALEKSKEYNESFCRVLVTLKDNTMVNILISQGRVCTVVRILDHKVSLEPPPDKCFEKPECYNIPVEEIASVRLYRVSTKASLAQLLHKCTTKVGEYNANKPEPQEKPGETKNPSREEGEEERRGEAPEKEGEEREPAGEEKKPRRRGLFGFLRRRRE